MVKGMAKHIVTRTRKFNGKGYTEITITRDDSLADSGVSCDYIYTIEGYYFSELDDKRLLCLGQRGSNEAAQRYMEAVEHGFTEGFKQGLRVSDDRFKA